MEIEAKLLLNKLQKMKENDVTRNVIIPLLETLGYQKVEFYGGPSEEGKDIVCWEVDRFGDIRLIVAQVKHFKFSNKASDTISIQTIVNQLQNCLARPLLYTDKTPYLPSEVFLITTYPIDTKTLQTRFTAFPTLQDFKIKIIDGHKLISLLKQHCPILISKILGIDVEINAILRDTLNNEVLLSALGYRNKKDIKHIYTDIDFSLGKRNTQLFFNTVYSPTKGEVNIELRDWLTFKDICEKTRNEFPLNYIDSDLAQIEEIVARRQEHNRSVQKKIDEVAAKQKTMRDELMKLQGLQKELMSQIAEEKKVDKAITEKLSKVKTKIDKCEQKSQKNEAQIAKLVDEIISEVYSINIDGDKLAAQLMEKRNWIELTVQYFNENSPSIQDVKNFIEKCKLIIDLASMFFSNPSIYGRVGYDLRKVNRQSFDSTRLKLPIANIFDTGLNILVLGEAGAGKSTSLQMYAITKGHGHERLVIFVPLANALQNWAKRKIPETFSERIHSLDHGIASYLASKGISITQEQFSYELSTRPTVLLLDGIDEAIGQNAWLIPSIEHLAKKYSKFLQIIVTSRTSGAYLDSISFFGVTLLPFTHEQRNVFIDKWFDRDTEEDLILRDKLKNHLNDNESVSKAITNPLLLTTLCVLANKDIKLPTTEIKLYNERLNLYTGYYDTVKGIERRINSTPTNLELVARKLAFWMHQSQKREELKDVLQEQAIELTYEEIGRNEADLAFKELIDPCNILIPMTDNGKYGFGHLQFQEHLVAKEIAANRSIEIPDLIGNQWWTGALIFFAQMNSDLYWLITKIAERVNISSVEETISKMVETRPLKEQQSLKKMIKTFLDSQEAETIRNYLKRDD